MLMERARTRMADEVQPYLLDDEILQNVMPATRGAHPLLVATLGAAITVLLYQWLPLLIAIFGGAAAAGILAVVTERPVVLAATDHAVIVLNASWLGNRPVTIDARLPRRSCFEAEDGVYAPVHLGESIYWVPFTWADEATQADEAWAAVGRVPNPN
jgi:hypothetical protein